MTDANLRELERRFRASGTVKDEAAWLRARLYSGELEQSRLEIAAHLGHGGALTALALPPDPSRDPTAQIEAMRTRDVGSADERLALRRERYQAGEDALRLLDGLRSFGLEACVRAAAAAVGLLEARFKSLEPSSRAYRASLDWLECPTQEFSEECRRLTDLIAPRFNDSGWKQHAVKCLAAAAGSGQGGEGTAIEAIRYVGTAGCSMSQVLAVIVENVVPWALGYPEGLGDSDPFCERAEARQQDQG